MRALQIIYFVVLFGILGSYLVFAIPSNALRLHVAAAESLSPGQQNMVAVWARNLDNGSIFHGYTLRSRWVNSAFEAVDEGVTETAVGYSGDAVFPMPGVPSVGVAALEVSLIDSAHKEKKSAYLPVSAFQAQPSVVRVPETGSALAQEVPKLQFHAFAPAAFMFNSPNDVLLSLFDDGKAYDGNLKLFQLYGQAATFPETAVMRDGLARISVSLQSAADFQIKAGDMMFVATFVPNERPLHVRISDYQIAPDIKPEVRVTPVGTMPTVTVDYFEGGAWVDRQTERPAAAARFPLEPKYVVGDAPSLIFARVSSSAFTTGENAQVFPIIASPRALSELEQLQFAMKWLGDCEALHPEIAYMRDVLNEKKPSAGTVRVMRDYVMGELASCHVPSVEVRVRSEDRDQQIFASRKDRQKRVSNYLLVFWFGLGAVVSAVLLMRQRKQARDRWTELLEAGTVEVGQLPQQTSALQLFYVIILFIGFVISLFYIMQII